MPQTTLTVNGRDYEIACGEGEETHLANLASVINGHIKGLADQVGQVGEARMLLMTALVLADEIDELRRNGSHQAPTADFENLNQQMGNFAERIEKIAARLESA